jgi:hypothetical protein
MMGAFIRESSNEKYNGRVFIQCIYKNPYMFYVKMGFTFQFAKKQLIFDKVVKNNARSGIVSGDIIFENSTMFESFKFREMYLIGENVEKWKNNDYTKCS